jgi:hypothetical protein
MIRDRLAKLCRYARRTSCPRVARATLAATKLSAYRTLALAWLGCLQRLQALPSLSKGLLGLP